MERYHPGYTLHWIHTSQLAKTPWGWRPALVTTVDGGRLTAEYLHGEGAVTLWHHRPLRVVPGSPVRVHEGFHALEVGGAWLNVRIDSGAGPVPEPEHPELWAAETTIAVTDVAAGEGIPLSPEEAHRLRDGESPGR